MLTAKGKYGLKAVAHLASLAPDELALAAEIADANNIPKKFLDAILGDLRNAGIVHSKKGPGGGYRLARRPDEIKLIDVIRLLDGPIAPIACVSRTAYRPCEDCDDIKRCTVRLAMLKVREAMAQVLDETSVDDMMRLDNILEVGSVRKTPAAARKRPAARQR